MDDGNRLRERALALPIAALVLFSPPILAILGRPVGVAGVPLSVVYIFGAWLVLIVLGRALARRLEPAVARAEPGVTGLDGPGEDDTGRES